MLDRTLSASGIRVTWTGMSRKPTPTRVARSSSGRKPAAKKSPPRSKALEIVPDVHLAPPTPITTKAFWPLMDR